jgi:photosystem II stability/assembly factor-like uncharacterized protein
MNMFKRSQDGGLNWESISLGCDPTVPAQVFVNPVNPDQIFMSWKSGRATASQDGGQTWQPMLVDGQDINVFDLAFDRDDVDHLVLAGDGVWKSGDGGATWKACELFTDPIEAFMVVEGESISLIPQIETKGEPVFAYHSDDNCATWWKALNGLPSWVSAVSVDPARPGSLLAATAGAGVFRTDSGGADWLESNNGMDSPAVIGIMEVSPSDPEIILAGSWSPRLALFHSDNRGVSWSLLLLDRAISSLLIHPQDPQQAWVAMDGSIYFSTDSIQWTPEYSGATDVSNLTASMVDPDHPYAFAINKDQAIFLHREDKIGDPSSHSWQSHVVSDLTALKALAVNPSNPLDVMVAGYGDSDTVLVRSLDGGHTWHSISSPMPVIRSMAIDPQNPAIRYLGGQQVLRSTNGGDSFETWSEGLPVYFGQVTSLVVDRLSGVYLLDSLTGIYHRPATGLGWEMVAYIGAGSGVFAYQPGDSPYLLVSSWDGLWRLDLPSIQRVWLPYIRR